MKNIGILIEMENGLLKGANLEMITLARAPDTRLTAFASASLTLASFSGGRRRFQKTTFELHLSLETNRPRSSSEARIEATPS